jgi:hypothetical protein
MDAQRARPCRAQGIPRVRYKVRLVAAGVTATVPGF